MAALPLSRVARWLAGIRSSCHDDQSMHHCAIAESSTHSPTAHWLRRVAFVGAGAGVGATAALESSFTLKRRRRTHLLPDWLKSERRGFSPPSLFTLLRSMRYSSRTDMKIRRM